jgi:hypothetical protein
MGLRCDRRGTGEVQQSLAALTVIMVSVGLVMAAVHASTEQGAERAKRERAVLQGEVCLDALERDAALDGADAALSLAGAQGIQGARERLAFAPPSLKVVTLRAVTVGEEVWVLGSAADLAEPLVFVERPVAVEVGGIVAPGVLRVGVEG